MRASELATPSQIRDVQKLQAALDGIQLNVNADWAVVWRELRDGESADPLQQLGRAGFWKFVTDPPRLPRCVFEVPLCVSDQIGADEEGDPDVRLAGLRKLVDAATATLDGNAPSGWTAPSAEEVAGWIGGGEALTVQCAEVACQGRVMRTDTRLAIEFPILANIPANLAPTRRLKLNALLLETHNKWRMVRIGLRDQAHGAQSAIAELDLTGLPAPAIEPLLRYAVDALHHIVRWAGAPAALLVDERACELLDR
jgi:hypothetical protein